MHRLPAQAKADNRRPDARKQQSALLDHWISPSRVFPDTSQVYRKASCACGGGCPACQAKSSGLKISQPNDPAEIEADQIADRVMRMPDDISVVPTGPVGVSTTTPILQRREAEGEQPREEGSRCPSWRADPESISKRAGEFYVRNHLTPPSQATVERIKCEPPIANGNYGCYVYFSDGLVLRVLVRETDIVVGTGPGPITTEHPPPATPLCFYEYSCPEGELVLTVKKCQSAKPSGSSGPPAVVQRAALSGAMAPRTAPSILHDLLNSSGQQLDSATRAFFEPRFGYALSHVRVHSDPLAAYSAESIQSRAYTLGNNIVFGGGEYRPHSESGRRLLAHELAHVVQQSGSDGFAPGQRNPQGGVPFISSPAHGLAAHGGTIVQRDLASEPTNPHPQEVNLTAGQIRDAIKFNRRRYDEESTRLIQDVVGAPQTGVFDVETIRLIARYPDDFGLTPVDGKVGPDTFDQLTSELQAENVDDQTCLTMFNLTDPTDPLDIRVAGPGLADIFSRFNITARFSPHCNCDEFDYRQFICGSVDRTRGGVVTNMNNVFSIPGGGLPQCPGWVEDGNTTQPQNGRYGHRDHTPRVNNRYLDDTGAVDMANGCRFEAFDVPGLFEVPDNSGDRYDFDIRFFGDVRRNGRSMQRKFWAVRNDMTIP